MVYVGILLVLLIVIAILVLRHRRQKYLDADIPNASETYRKREKEKALKNMSLLMRQKAEALNEGDVSDLEFSGNTAIAIMEATGTVYEWDGSDWIDRYPNQPMFGVKPK